MWGYPLYFELLGDYTLWKQAIIGEALPQSQILATLDPVYEPLPLTFYRYMKITTTLEKVNKALSKIQDAGTVQIDWNKWSFSVKWVEWRFSYDQDTKVLQIVIDDKPWLASESMVDREIIKFFQS